MAVSRIYETIFPLNLDLYLARRLMNYYSIRPSLHVKGVKQMYCLLTCTLAVY